MSLFVGFSLDYKDDSVESLLPLKDHLENPDHSVLYKTCSDLTKVYIPYILYESVNVCNRTTVNHHNLKMTDLDFKAAQQS